MVADRLKEVMSYKLREYILGKEGADWMRPGEVAAAADTYIANVGDTQYTNSRPRHDAETLRNRNNAVKDVERGPGARSTYANTKTETRSPTRPPFPSGRGKAEITGAGKDRNLPRPGIQCYNCSGPHFARNCPSTRRVNQVTVEERTELMTDQELNREHIDMINMNETDQTFSADNVIYRISNETINKVNHDITINIVDKQIKCIVDSGADISVLHSDLVPTQYDEPRGRIRLKSAFGHTIDANVLTLPVRLIQDDADESVPAGSRHFDHRCRDAVARCWSALFVDAQRFGAVGRKSGECSNEIRRSGDESTGARG